MKEASPYVRSVLITAAAIGLELEKQNIDLNGDQFSPEYLKVSSATFSYFSVHNIHFS